MAFVYSILTEITTLPGTVGAVYTNAASTTAYIRSITLHNANTTTEAVILWNVPDNGGAGGTAADTNQFFSQSLLADETVIIEWPAPGLQLEDTNDTIQADTTTASKVTIQIMGAKET